MQAPNTVGALLELLHGANWMRTAIPDVDQLIDPLHDLLDSEYARHKSRKTILVTNRPISAWGGGFERSCQ